MVTEFYERDNTGISMIAKLSYPTTWILLDNSVKELLDNGKFKVLNGKFDYNNIEHHRLLPIIISGQRLWAITV